MGGRYQCQEILSLSSVVNAVRNLTMVPEIRRNILKRWKLRNSALSAIR